MSPCPKLKQTERKYSSYNGKCKPMRSCNAQFHHHSFIKIELTAPTYKFCLKISAVFTKDNSTANYFFKCKDLMVYWLVYSPV